MVNVPMLWVSLAFNSPSSNHVSRCKRLCFMLSRRCVQYWDAFSVIKIVTCPSWVGERCFWPFNMNQIKQIQTLHARLLALQDQPHRDTYCWRPCVLFGPRPCFHLQVFVIMPVRYVTSIITSSAIIFCGPTGRKCYVDVYRSCSEDTWRGESLELAWKTWTCQNAEPMKFDHRASQSLGVSWGCWTKNISNAEEDVCCHTYR